MHKILLKLWIMYIKPVIQQSKTYLIVKKKDKFRIVGLQAQVIIKIICGDYYLYVIFFSTSGITTKAMDMSKYLASTGGRLLTEHLVWILYFTDQSIKSS